MDAKLYCVTNLCTRPLELIRAENELYYEYIPPDKTYFLEMVVFAFGSLPRDKELQIILQLDSSEQKISLGCLNDETRILYWRSNSDIECAQLEILRAVQGHLKERSVNACTSASQNKTDQKDLPITSSEHQSQAEHNTKLEDIKPASVAQVKKKQETKVQTVSKLTKDVATKGTKSLTGIQPGKGTATQGTIGQYFVTSSETEPAHGENKQQVVDASVSNDHESSFQMSTVVNGEKVQQTEKVVQPHTTTRARRPPKASAKEDVSSDKDDVADGKALNVSDDSKGEKSPKKLVSSEKLTKINSKVSTDTKSQTAKRGPKSAGSGNTEPNDKSSKGKNKASAAAETTNKTIKGTNSKKQDQLTKNETSDVKKKAKPLASDKSKQNSSNVSTAGKTVEKENSNNVLENSSDGKSGKTTKINGQNADEENEESEPSGSQDVNNVSNVLTTKHRRPVKRSSRWDDFVDSSSLQARSPNKKKKVNDNPSEEKKKSNENKELTANEEEVKSSEKCGVTEDDHTHQSVVSLVCKSQIDASVATKNFTFIGEIEPSPRWGHSISKISDTECLMVGGQGEKQVYCKDSIWLLNIEKSEWKVPETTVTEDSAKPEARTGHTVTYDPTVRALYLFGGSKNRKWFSDVHVLDIVDWKWQLVAANGSAPTRAYHSTTLYRHELWIFGGVYPCEDPTPDGCSNDIHVFSPIEESWYMPVIMGSKPLPRSGHSSTLLKDLLVLFGGWDSPNCFNDLHVLDMSLVEWSQPDISGPPPSPRCWHTSCALSGNRVLIHGGYDGNNALSDSAILNLDYKTWIHVQLAPSPIPRAGHVSLYLPNQQDSSNDHEQILVFGGGDNCNKFFNDLYAISIPSEVSQNT